ncbi:MAG: YrzA family protein [Bacillus sp. (in: Bacteria)]|nr:YrzA family protein [Bacillus sp. (in: firmicutes)]
MFRGVYNDTNSVFKDKVEFFEAGDLGTLEKQIAKKIEDNQAIMLGVHHVSHEVTVDPKTGRRSYSAVVHFKATK